MASLREIKDRIASVRGTLKITSAMKMVASSKLRRAQKAIEAMRPYEEELSEILNECGAGVGPAQAVVIPEGKRAIVAISSNSSLCGGFNNTAIKVAYAEAVKGESTVFSLGRKMADTMKKAGYPSPKDFVPLIAHPAYSDVAELSNELTARFEAGEFVEVVLVYMHFVSNSRQEVRVERFLPFSVGSFTGESAQSAYLLEPGRAELLAVLRPKVLSLKLYAAILDSAAAEHAARTLAMQTASDNAQDLLGELSLEYNKGRQQKITNEILDLVGGAELK